MENVVRIRIMEGIMTDKPVKFSNLNELTAYLTQLENRVALAESDNKAQREIVERMAGENKALADFIRERIPKTTLFSRSFMLRAFTVWWHYFVAQLIIALGVFALVMVVSLLAFGGLGGLVNLAGGF